MPDLHSTVVGGSNCHRALKCPFSLQGLASPTTVRAPDAEEGTALHAAVQLEIYGMPTLGMSMPVACNDGVTRDYLITPELHDECVAPTLAMAQEVLAMAGPGATFECERTAPFPRIPGAFGTCDFSVYSADGKLFAALDYKFGRRDAVGVRDQLTFYACAIRGAGGYNVPDTGTRLFVAAPRLSRELMDYGAVTFPDMLVFAQNLVNALGRRDAKAGPWCRFCPKAATCPTAAADATKAVAMPVPHPPMVTPEAVALAKQVKDWAEAVLAEAKEQLLAGHPLPGYGLGVKAFRMWADPHSAEAMLRNRGVAPYGTSLISPAQAETAGIDKAIVKDHVKPDVYSSPALCKLPLRGFREYDPNLGGSTAPVAMPKV